MSRSYSVSLIPQQTPSTCWFACIKMLASHGSPWLYAFIHDGDESKLSAIKSPAEMTQMAYLVGMHCEASKPGSYSIKQKLLNGPAIWVGRSAAGRIAGATHHAVVLTGYDDSGPEILLYINDSYPVGKGQRLILSKSELEAQLVFDRILNY